MLFRSSGPQGYQGFMSPYQQDVIDATLSEYDSQAAQGLAGIGQQIGRASCRERV